MELKEVIHNYAKYDKLSNAYDARKSEFDAASGLSNRISHLKNCVSELLQMFMLMDKTLFGTDNIALAEDTPVKDALEMGDQAYENLSDELARLVAEGRSIIKKIEDIKGVENCELAGILPKESDRMEYLMICHRTKPPNRGKELSVYGSILKLRRLSLPRENWTVDENRECDELEQKFKAELEQKSQAAGNGTNADGENAVMKFAGEHPFCTTVICVVGGAVLIGLLSAGGAVIYVTCIGDVASGIALSAIVKNAVVIGGGIGAIAGLGGGIALSQVAINRYRAKQVLFQQQVQISHGQREQTDVQGMVPHPG